MYFPDFSILILIKKKQKKIDLKIEALIVGWVNKEKEREEKKKTNYHLSLFHYWTRALPFIPNKNNSLGLKNQTT